MSFYEDIILAMIDRLSGTEDEPTKIREMGVEMGKLEEFRGNHKPVIPEKGARITVGFYQQMFGTERAATEITLGKTAQKSDIYFMVSIAGRTLYGPKGVYTIIAEAFKLLIGWQYNFHPLAAYSADFLTLDENNAWVYQMLFRFRDVTMIGSYLTEIDPQPSEEDYILKEIDVDAETCLLEIAGTDGEEILIDPDPDVEGDEGILVFNA